MQPAILFKALLNRINKDDSLQVFCILKFAVFPSSPTTTYLCEGPFLLLVNVRLLKRCESYIKGISLLGKQRDRLEHSIADVLFFVAMDLYLSFLVSFGSTHLFLLSLITMFFSIKC